MSYIPRRFLGVDGLVTTDETLTEIISNATLLASGVGKIVTASLVATGGPLWIIPNVSADDPLNANADAAQANVTVTDGTKFTANDIVLLYNNDNTSYEWAEILSIATHVLTMKAVLVKAYTTAKVSMCAKVRNRNEFFKVGTGETFNEEDLDFTSLWYRNTSGVNVTLNGYVGAN